jgi:single-stranded-DNA-specific exonuclease
VSRETIWQVRRADQAAVESIRRELGVSRITAQVLVARGAINSAIARQRYQLSEESLHSPWLLPDIKAAVKRIAEAIARQELITVYGDYDVDGQTATALLVTVLRRLQARVRYYIPSRFDEGYGLNAQAVTEIAQSGSTLLPEKLHIQSYFNMIVPVHNKAVPNYKCYCGTNCSSNFSKHLY